MAMLSSLMQLNNTKPKNYMIGIIYIWLDPAQPLFACDMYVMLCLYFFQILCKVK